MVAAMVHTIRLFPSALGMVIYAWAAGLLAVSAIVALRVRRHREALPSPFVTWLPVIGFLVIVFVSTQR